MSSTFRQTSRARADLPLAVLSACMFLSGASALAYQVVWSRLLMLPFGSTSASVSAVLGAFFLGMAAGGLLARPLSRGDERSVLATYARLEAAIALFGLATLPLFLHLDAIVVAVPAVGGSTSARFMLALAILLPGSTCIGATWPVIAALLARNAENEERPLAVLYGWNTAGAVLGALGTAFLLFPALGLIGALVVAAVVNLLVALAVIATRERLAGALGGAGPGGHRFLPSESKGKGPGPRDWARTFHSDSARRAAGRAPSARAPRAARRVAVLALVLGGGATLSMEVAGTKLLSVLVGTTLFSFAAILAVFLTAIALGAWLLRLLPESLDRPRLAAGLLLFAGAGLSLSRFGLSFAPALHQTVRSAVTDPALRLAGDALMGAALFTLPVAALGALFPLATGILARGEARDRLGGDTGGAWALNTLAGTLGAAGSGLWLVPWLGSDGVLALCTALLGAGGALGFLYLRRPGERPAWMAAASIAVLASTFVPGIDYRALLDSARRDLGAREEALAARYVYAEEGRNGLISVAVRDDAAFLYLDGLKEAWINLETDEYPIAEALLGLLPVLFHGEPDSAFVVGFGAGHTSTALAAAGVDRVRTVELEPRVVEAIASVRPERVASFRSPPHDLRFADARHVLLTEDTRYDLIVSQPSHPWRAGAGNLFTRQFFDLVSVRLDEGGIFAQWLNLFRMDAPTLRSLMGTFFDVFPSGCLFSIRRTNDLILIGSPDELRLDVDRARAIMAQPAVAEILEQFQIRDYPDFMQLFALSRREALMSATGVPRNTDTRLLSEVRLGLLPHHVRGSRNPYRALSPYGSFDVGPFLEREEAARLTASYALHLERQGNRKGARRVLERLRELDAEAHAEVEPLIER